MASGPLAVFENCDRLLQLSASTLDTLVAEGLRGAPPRRYVADGLPAFDCTQLTVHASMASEELTNPLAPSPATGSRQKAKGWINLINYTVTIVRCIPVIQGVAPPGEVPIERSAEQIYADGWSLWCSLHRRAMAGDLFGGDKCEVRRWMSSHGVDPAGGFGGWTINLQSELDGYDPLPEV